MKQIAYSILVYFLLAFSFKLFGDMNKNAWVNYYWVFSSLFFCFLFFKLSNFCDLQYFKSKYKSIDLNFYKHTIISASIYWGVIFIVRVIVAFNIELYNKLISSARTFTIGGVTIVLIFIYLTYLTAKKND